MKILLLNLLLLIEGQNITNTNIINNNFTATINKTVQMNNTKTIGVDINDSITITSSASKAFQIISDHVGTPNWVKEVKEVKLLKEGNPKNGKGAIREVNFKPLLWSTVQEKIVAYTENKEYQYKIIKMAGVVDHLGVWSITELGNGEIEVFWKIHMEFKKNHIFRLLFSNQFIKAFTKVQKNALMQLKSILETP